jgi:hypothetical protein
VADDAVTQAAQQAPAPTASTKAQRLVAPLADPKFYVQAVRALQEIISEMDRDGVSPLPPATAMAPETAMLGMNDEP